MDRREKGKMGEDVAAKYLQDDGYLILERGFRCKTGEIDIIAKKGGELYFIEVKARWSNDFGNPLESVTYFKQKRFIAAAKFYLASKRFFNVGCHLSAIGVDMCGDEPRLEFVKDAFEI